MPQCISPLGLGHGTVSCGQCMPCRINQKRKQASKIVLEAAINQFNTFGTLTYEDTAVPLTVDGVPTLRKAEAKAWLGSVAQRFAVKTTALRYYMVGEYGDQTKRPHYHIVLFGIDWYAFDQVATATWSKGFHQSVNLTDTRSEYIAGYTTKKLTKADDERLAPGQEPEFKIQSHRPALGRSYLDKVVEWYSTDAGSTALAAHGDISHCYRFKGKLWPLTDYQKRYIRGKIGIPTTREGLQKLREDPISEINTPPTLEEIQEREVRHAQTQKRKEIFAQRTQRI